MLELLAIGLGVKAVGLGSVHSASQKVDARRAAAGATPAAKYNLRCGPVLVRDGLEHAARAESLERFEGGHWLASAGAAFARTSSSATRSSS